MPATNRFWLAFRGFREEIPVMILDRLTDLEKTPLGRNRDGAEYNLSHFRHFLSEIGNPQQGQYFVHIAGTKGKGSTAALTEALLRGLGFPVATFTSPHLSHYGERFRFDGVPLSLPDFERRMDAFIASLPGEHRHAIENAQSYRTVFELLTAFALAEFGERARKMATESTNPLPQIVVWETGLGGRLDCTNVVNSFASVITPLGIDHAAILGDTIEKIAREKAGIIKPGRPVILSRQSPQFEAQVLPIIAEEAEGNGSILIKAWEENSVTLTSTLTDGQWIRMTDSWELGAESFLPLHGQFQLTNLESAITAALMVAAKFDRQPTCKKLLAGLSLVDWPGRFEVHRTENETLIIDGAHCPLSAAALGAEIARLQRERVVLLWGMQKEKDHHAFLEELCRAMAPTKLEKIFCYPLPPPRGSDAAMLAQSAQEYGMNAEEHESLPAAFNAAMQSHLPVIAAGTLYSVAEIKALWKKHNG